MRAERTVPGAVCATGCTLVTLPRPRPRAPQTRGRPAAGEIADSRRTAAAVRSHRLITYQPCLPSRLLMLLRGLMLPSYRQRLQLMMLLPQYLKWLLLQYLLSIAMVGALAVHLTRRLAISSWLAALFKIFDIPEQRRNLHAAVDGFEGLGLCLYPVHSPEARTLTSRASIEARSSCQLAAVWCQWLWLGDAKSENAVSHNLIPCPTTRNGSLFGPGSLQHCLLQDNARSNRNHGCNVMAQCQEPFLSPLASRISQLPSVVVLRLNCTFLWHCN